MTKYHLTVILSLGGLLAAGCATNDQPPAAHPAKAKPVKYHRPGDYEWYESKVASADDFQMNSIAGNFERNPPFGPRSNKVID